MLEAFENIRRARNTINMIAAEEKYKTIIDFPDCQARTYTNKSLFRKTIQPTELYFQFVFLLPFCFSLKKEL